MVFLVIHTHAYTCRLSSVLESNTIKTKKKETAAEIKFLNHGSGEYNLASFITRVQFIITIF